MKKGLLIKFVVAIILSFFLGGCQKQKTISNQQSLSSTPTPTIKPMSKTIEKPTIIIDVNKSYTAILKTSEGDITIKLFADSAPVTVNNFIYLAKQNFYNDTIFHRVIKDFMIQGGDPLGNGTGGPGYQFEDEMSDKKLIRGSLAMANSGVNTNGSQFFIVTLESTPWLDGKHTNFGIVTSGMEIVDKIEATETNMNDKPLKDIIINSVEIIEE